MTTIEQKKLELRAVKLVFDYYRYFMCCDEAKSFGRVHYDSGSRWNWQKRTYTQQNDPEITINLRTYKIKEKKAEVDKFRNMLMLSPDMEIVQLDPRYPNNLKVNWVNLELPSIKNNTLGFERNVSTEKYMDIL